MSDYTVEKAENCFALSQTYIYELPLRVDRGFLATLGDCFPYGALRIKENTRRPFYFFEYEGVQVKGALNDDRLKASFPNEGMEEAKREFELALTRILKGCNDERV